MHEHVTSCAAQRCAARPPYRRRRLVNEETVHPTPARLGADLRHLAAVLSHLGTALGHLGDVLGQFGAILRAQFGLCQSDLMGHSFLVVLVSNCPHF